MSEEYIPEETEDHNDELELYVDDAEEMEEEYEEISSEEVDRVVAVLEDLVETVDSENVRTYLEDAVNGIYYLVYEDEGEEDADPGVASEAA